jgi:hypothetical protein
LEQYGLIEELTISPHLVVSGARLSWNCPHAFPLFNGALIILSYTLINSVHVMHIQNMYVLIVQGVYLHLFKTEQEINRKDTA